MFNNNPDDVWPLQNAGPRLSLPLSPLGGEQSHFRCSWRVLIGWTQRGFSFSFSLLPKRPGDVERRQVCCCLCPPPLRRRLDFLHHPPVCTPHSSVFVSQLARIRLSRCLSRLCIIYIPWMFALLQLLSVFLPDNLPVSHLSAWWCRAPLCLTSSILPDASARRCMPGRLSPSLPLCLLGEKKWRRAQPRPKAQQPFFIYSLWRFKVCMYKFR